MVHLVDSQLGCLKLLLTIAEVVGYGAARPCPMVHIHEDLLHIR